MTTTFPSMLFPILFVADLLQPLDGLAIEPFLNRDMRHRGRRRRTVPVFFSRREPDDVAGTDVFDRAAPALRAPAPSGDDQRLTERMGVPRGPGARLERDAGADRTRRIGRLKQRIDTDRAGEVLVRPLTGWLRTAPFDLHASER